MVQSRNENPSCHQPIKRVERKSNEARDAKPPVETKMKTIVEGEVCCVANVHKKDCRPKVWIIIRRTDRNSTGFIKRHAVVDTGAVRSAMSMGDAQKLKLLKRGKVTVKNAAGGFESIVVH
mmetsp:Transcript_2231/g.4280  ORF Transcript_2231/g.4280 Transcript_2231/m.4280 type:complete len:121 (+) Transcript_2231:244-606(+)